MQNNEEMRKEFEVWAKSEGYALHEPWQYEKKYLDGLWEGFQAAKSTAWRDIKDAPKDGTEVLGYSDYAEIIAFRNGKWINTTIGDSAYPTHFQYLPTPPNTNNKG